jgi:hypothetical protein
MKPALAHAALALVAVQLNYYDTPAVNVQFEQRRAEPYAGGAVESDRLSRQRAGTKGHGNGAESYLRATPRPPSRKRP